MFVCCSLFTNSNWFTFKGERADSTPVSTSLSDAMEDINLNRAVNGGNSSSDDEVVVGEDEVLTEAKDSSSAPSSSEHNHVNELGSNLADSEECKNDKMDLSFETEPLGFSSPDSKDLFGEAPPVSDWVNWCEASGLVVEGSSTNPFVDDDQSVDHSNANEVTTFNSSVNREFTLPNGSSRNDDQSLNSDISEKPSAAPSLFEEDVEFVGVEPEGTEKAMEQALKEGIVGEAGPLKKKAVPLKVPDEKPDDGAPGTEFNDANYWRFEQEVAVLE